MNAAIAEVEEAIRLLPKPTRLTPRYFRNPVPPDRDAALIRRFRHAACVTAFSVAASLPFLWLIATPDYARRNRRLIAEAMLALSLFGTIGMMLGWGYWRNYNRFDLRQDAAGWGLILIPLGAMAVMTAMWRDRREDRADHCHECDYDLSGNVSGVCPECGAAVAGAGDSKT